MQLQTFANQIDFYPCTPAAKRFVKRVIWYPGAESEVIFFSTVVKSDALYSISNLIANGATVTDFNLHSYTGDDYSPVMCWYDIKVGGIDFLSLYGIIVM